VVGGGATQGDGLPPVRRRAGLLALIAGDPLAIAALVWLSIVAVALVAGPTLLANDAVAVKLVGRNIPPFRFDLPVVQWLGTDSLGRSMLARLSVAATNALGIAFASVGASLVFGTLLGIVAGYFGGLAGNLILRVADMILGFPTLLLALVVLYIFGPNVTNLIVVLAVTRMPAYVRVARAEVLEVRERLFVDAARALGASHARILITHILPTVAPTLLTLASLNLAMVMLIESGLSFLGLGIQPPSVSWGLMVAQGRAYLSQAWWLSCFPGLAIMLTTLAFNLLASWFRTATDPQQRWRLERPGNGA
jgi:peptide/nickel transport system permease protein